MHKSIIVRGGPIHMANGIFFDARDRLHIASVLGGEITVMDREHGLVLDRLRGEVGVDGPDGSLLVVEVGTQRLLRIDGQTGRLSAVANELAVGAPTIKGFLPHGMLNGVAVGPSGTIFVTGDIDNVVYRLAR